nr:hypothetical protein [uncultured Flavobacterium sp.]
MPLAILITEGAIIIHYGIGIIDRWEMLVHPQKKDRWSFFRLKAVRI